MTDRTPTTGEEHLPQPGRLTLEPGAESLPLRRLSHDVVRRRGSLVVALRQLPMATGGGVMVPAVGQVELSIILLDPDVARRLGHTLEEVYAHELAHIIDPATATARPGTREQRELYANVLGALLLIERPTTLAEARVLHRRWASRLGPTLKSSPPESVRDAKELVRLWRRQHRLSFENLDRLLRPASTIEAAERLGVSRRSLSRWRSDGISVPVADQVAIRAGYHPCEVWPEWSSASADLSR